MHSQNLPKKILSPFWKIQIITFLLIMLTHAVTAQKKIAARLIVGKDGATLSKVFKKYALFSINTNELAQYTKQKKNDSQVKIDLDFPGHSTMKLEIREHDILAINYQMIVATPQGKQAFAKPACITYSGKLTNDNSSSVYLTITDKNIYGYIKGNGKEYF